MGCNIDKLKDILLNEISQSQRVNVCLLNVKFIETGGRMGDYQGLGEKGK